MKNNQENQEKEVLTPEVEIVQTSIVPVKQQQSGVAMLFTPEKKEQLIKAFIQTEVSNYSTSPETCKKLVKESKKLTIKDKNDKEGFEKLQKKYREFVKVRTSTEKERKFIVEPYVKIKEGIDDVGKTDILGLLKPEEERMKSELDQWKKWEEEEAERKAEEEKKKLDQRISELEEEGLKFDSRFYSIGGEISVDVVTIKDLSEEDFQELKSRVKSVNEKLQEAERVQNLHNERREQLLEFWAYVPDDFKTQNFGEMFEENFTTLLEQAKKGKEDFDKQQKQQQEEAERQANERKNLNYEKRSFKFEKKGFEVQENGNVLFSGESGQVLILKKDLEEISEEDFNNLFEEKIKSQSKIIEDDKNLKSKREQEAQEKANEQASANLEEERKEKENSRIDALLKIGLKLNIDYGYIFEDINFSFVEIKTMSDAEFSNALIGATRRKAELDAIIAKQEEAEKVSNLPEIEKAERYVEEIMKVNFPQLQNDEIIEILAELKNKIKLASDEALSNLKKLK